VASLKLLFLRQRHRLAYAATVGLFVWFCSHFYLPGQGFTYLVMFGAKSSAAYLPELRALNHYEQEDTYGYDAQYYAQIAMRPHIADPELKQAVDSLPYRARRILFCWTAYGLALGDPARALHIYAAQNMVCWLLLAWLLLRWFPPVSWGNYGRWLGVLFAYGLCFSVRGSLVDGPSLLLIAAGVALAETGRPWWAAAVLGVAGLGKETNVLGAAALAPKTAGSRRDWTRSAAQCALVALPLALWLALIWRWLGPDGGMGLRNFGAPFAAYFQKWRIAVAHIAAVGPSSPEKWSVLMLVSVTVQFLFFALRPRWDDPWWRVAVSYAVLMAFLGEAVWEGYPGAASRVLLPMTLAFNILVPRGGLRWTALLLAGNLTVLVTTDLVHMPGRESYRVEGPRALRMAETNGHIVEANFDGQWYQVERSWLEYWRWSKGSAAVTLRNPHPFALRVNATFDLRALDRRTLVLQSGGRTLWKHTVSLAEPGHIELRDLRLEPGETVLRCETDRPAIAPVGDEHRLVAFNLRNLKLEILGRADGS